MKIGSSGLLALAMTLMAGASASADRRGPARSGYSYIRVISGDVTVVSRWNGRVEAKRNMPISAGDEIILADGARAETALADGNLLHLGGGTRARFESLYAQQGESDDFSSIKLREGSAILSAVGANEDQIPRIDTQEATVYLNAGSRVRVNADRRRGTVVIGRAGTVEVKTRQGTYNLRAGQYLMVGEDGEPEIERGAFSRDRFDLWAADRIETLYETRSASGRYVNEEYASDVVALDGYGDWNYNTTYSRYVWVPRVDIGWSPYGYGTWYYTPVGLTWWSHDPWGWYPFHYGTWYYDSFWSRWCWVPAYVYSPAWVYWAYTPSYIGWCPIGYYSFYSPWYDTYYRRLGWYNRNNIYISIHGTFPTRTVDFRGWNFAGSENLGTTAARMEVIPGSRLVDRLGPQVGISSRPIVVAARDGAAREAVREFVREAPRVIERTGTTDASRLGPILARERTLPPMTVDALRDRGVVAERGRLAGPGVADVAPRGVVVDRGRVPGEIGRQEPTGRIGRERGAAEAPGREVIGLGGPVAGERGTAGAPGRDVIGRGRATDGAERPPHADRSEGRVISRPAGDEDWRMRGNLRSQEGGETPRRERSEALESPREIGRPERQDTHPGIDRPRVERDESAQPQPPDWRSRSRSAPAPREEGAAPPAARPPEPIRTEDWRSRSEVPPARRVIEGAVPGRRAPEAGPAEAPRRDPGPAREWRAREREAPAPREYRPESAPPPRIERAPAPPPPPPRSEPPPRMEVHRESPPHQSAPPPEHHERGRKEN